MLVSKQGRRQRGSNSLFPVLPGWSWVCIRSFQMTLPAIPFLLTFHSRREFKGQMNRGKQDREPLRGKFASEREVFRGFRGFRDFFRGFQRSFSEALSFRGRFPSQRLSVLLPLIVVPFELFPTKSKICARNYFMSGTEVWLKNWANFG